MSKFFRNIRWYCLYEMFKVVRWYIVNNINGMVRKVFWVVRERFDMCEYGSYNEYNFFIMFKCVCIVGFWKIYRDVEYCF